jgi:hypothetical protein
LLELCFVRKAANGKLYEDRLAEAVAWESIVGRDFRNTNLELAN